MPRLDRGAEADVAPTIRTGCHAIEARLERARRLGPAALLRKPIGVEEVCRACEP
jgi:hypothetical protein